MVASLRVFFGFVVGCAGFVMIGDSPAVGGSALLLSGFLILSGIDHLCNVLVNMD
jgi:hypothetical protein